MAESRSPSRARDGVCAVPSSGRSVVGALGTGPTADRAPRTPAYRCQKAKPYPRAFVELGGKRVYLGRWGTPESREAYHRTVAEWFASGGRPRVEPTDVTVTEIAAAFWEHAQRHYRRADGTPVPGSVDGYRHALAPLTRLYGSTQAISFGPTCLRAVRQEFVAAGLARRVVNQRTSLIRSVFKWAVGQEVLPPDVAAALSAVEPLKRGRTEAPDREPVRPVPEAFIEAIEPHVSGQVWALVQLGLLTGARAGELVLMRPVDLDTRGTTWTFRPMTHKTEYRGHERTIYLGPKAQEIVRPFLTGRPVDGFMFSPQEAEAERLAERHRLRITPLSCGNGPREKTERHARNPGNRYTVNSFRRAIERGCDAAFPLPHTLARRPGETVKKWRARLTPEELTAARRWRREHRWNPHRLRHNAGTNIRREYGIETARIILGHRTAGITQVYAEADQTKAAEAMRKLG